MGPAAWGKRMATDQDGTAVAQDDEGKPITEQDLVNESYRGPLEGSTFEVIPPFDFEGDEDDWETHLLVEAVRARRRAAKTGAAAT